MPGRSDRYAVFIDRPGWVSHKDDTTCYDIACQVVTSHHPCVASPTRTFLLPYHSFIPDFVRGYHIISVGAPLVLLWPTRFISPPPPLPPMGTPHVSRVSAGSALSSTCGIPCHSKPFLRLSLSQGGARTTSIAQAAALPAAGERLNLSFRCSHVHAPLPLPLLLSLLPYHTSPAYILH